jgi:hypothetical protein
MSVRVITIQEMLDLPKGAHAVLVKNVDDLDGGGLEAGAELTKKGEVFDDKQSVGFWHSSGQRWDFFEEGEVGVVEQTATNFDLSVFSPETGEPVLGVFRPDLDTRKVGKVRVELVDEGFPLALREVAKVMTWAQTAKGYKDHDWQNLPNAEVALAAAASRHRTDHIEQRVVKGLDTEECVDVESSLHHKAHEAFGVLAQLELMLRGKFVDKHTAYAV